MSNLIEVQEKIAELQKQEKLMLAQEYQSAKAQAQSLISTYKISASDLVFSAGGTAGAKQGKVASAGKKAEPKYHDESGNSWSGRGMKPKWLITGIENGKKLEEFLIQH